jgi:hypothetical protein
MGFTPGKRSTRGKIAVHDGARPIVGAHGGRLGRICRGAFHGVSPKVRRPRANHQGLRGVADIVKEIS